MSTVQEAIFETFQNVPLRQEFARYIVGELGDTASTAWTYEQSLRRIERFLGKSALEVWGVDMRRFFRDSDYHPSTKNGGLVAIKSLARFCRLEDAMGPEQVADLLSLRGPKKRRRMRRSMTTEEALTVLDACRTPNEYRVIYPGLYQGLRVSDSAVLRNEHFHGDRLMFTSIKGDKDLELPLHLEVTKAQDLILKRTPSRDSLKATCSSLAHYTGIPFTSHTLRRTFAKRMDDLGIQEGVVIELLGQEQITVYRRHYAGISWEAMVAAIEALAY